ncbi:MAG: hypothetical protein ACNYPH_04850 [Gammaproteobacteria bacterium WSBS_2016_MAG_OTU1]
MDGDNFLVRKVAADIFADLPSSAVDGISINPDTTSGSNSSTNATHI